MKKLAIFGMAAILVVGTMSMAFANPANFGNTSGGDSTSQANNDPAIEGENSASAGVGDVANQGSTITSDTKSTEVEVGDVDLLSGNTKTIDSNNTKTVTVDKSGQTNTDTYTKTEDSNNTKTVTVDKSGQTNDSNNTKTVTVDKSGQDNSKTVGDIASGNTKTEDSLNTKSEAEKNIAGAQNAGSGSATNTNDVDLLSGNTKTTTVDKSGQTNLGKTEAEKNIAGSQNAGVGNSATTSTSLLSGNTKTIDSNNTKTYNKTYNKAYADDGSAAAVGGDATNTKVSLEQETKYGSAASYSGDATVTKDSGNTKTVTIDKSGQVNKHNNANENYGSAVAQDGSTATNTYTKTTTIDKSGQNNSKVIDSYNSKNIQKIDDTKYGSAAAIGGDAKTLSDNTLFSNNTKNSNNSSSKVSYIVDSELAQINMNANETDPNCCPTPQINQSMTKNYTASTSDSFKSINGVVNYNQATGNFNSGVATTNFNLNGGVANRTP